MPMTNGTAGDFGYGFNITGKHGALLVSIGGYDEKDDAEAAAVQVRAAIQKAKWVKPHGG